MNTLPPLERYEHDERTLMLHCGSARVALTLLSPHIVRVRLAPQGNFAPRRSWALPCPDSTFAAVPFVVEETPDALIIRNDAAAPDLVLRVQRDPCLISFADANGNVFCADSAPMQWRGGAPDPQQSTTVWHIACEKHIDSADHFYGTGERAGLLDKRGYRLTNWTSDPGSNQGPCTDPFYIAIPVCMVARPGLAYGFYFNNTWHSSFDMGHADPQCWRIEAGGGELDYYVVYGPTPLDVSEGLAALLGTMPLPPRWALGYHQSRWSYAPEAEVRAVAEGFRSRDIPCDVIHLDIAYMDGYRVFTWDAERFPDPPRLLRDLRADGFRVVTIIDPGVKIDPDYHVYQQGQQHDAFIRRADGEVFQGYVWPDAAVFCDYTRAEVRAWWGTVQRALLEQGVSGIWNDMNEPTSFHQPFSSTVGKKTWGTLPLDAPQGALHERTQHAEVHNLFGSGMAQACYEGMRSASSERPFVLTRSAFAGIQCWSACWMGDNNSVWEHLEMAIPQLVNMGLSGVPFVGVDIGGFGGNASGELFARWMQFGALTPFCRGHTTHTSTRHEPWAFGAEVEAICRDALRLRYRLLPYLATLFAEAAQHGTPVLRPLFYHHPDDPAALSVHDQVLLGPFLLAAPVYRPGVTHRAVYLPAGTWYDWWSGETLHGPAHVLARAPLDTIPLYVRAGAIIPMGPAMRHTEERPLDPLTLHLFPGQGEFTLYEDDGLTFAYEQIDFCMTSYRLLRDEAGCALRFEIDERVGGYCPPDRRLEIVLHGVDAAAAALTDHPDAHYDAAQRTLTLVMDDDGSTHTFCFGGAV